MGSVPVNEPAESRLGLGQKDGHRRMEGPREERAEERSGKDIRRVVHAEIDAGAAHEAGEDQGQKSPG